MERQEILDLMGQLQLVGMRAAFDEVLKAGLKRQHPVQRRFHLVPLWNG
jgi:hypothetical protein